MEGNTCQDWQREGRGRVEEREKREGGIPARIASLSSSFFDLIRTNSWLRLLAVSVLLSTNTLTGWFKLSRTRSCTCARAKNSKHNYTGS